MEEIALLCPCSVQLLLIDASIMVHHNNNIIVLLNVNVLFQTVSELKRKEGQPWPTGRDAHAACCLGFGSDNPQLLIIGGIDPYDETIGDAWMLDFSSQTWRMVYINILRVYGHSLSHPQPPFMHVKGRGLAKCVYIGSISQCDIMYFWCA